MEIMRDGKFSLPITTTKLSKGLRKTSSNPVNTHGMITCRGVVGKEGVLQRIQELIATFSIEATFPYPQIFIETNVVIVCTDTRVYELNASGNLDLKYSVTAGSTWCLMSSHDYVYMSNGVASIVRDPISKTWAESSDLPTAMAICNFNGQVIVGAPNAGYNLGDE